MGQTWCTSAEPKSIGWQKVMELLHADAAQHLPRGGIRYEIRMVKRPAGETAGVAHPAFTEAAWIHDDRMNDYSAWIDVPVQEADYYRVGRYTTSKESR